MTDVKKSKYYDDDDDKYKGIKDLKKLKKMKMIIISQYYLIVLLMKAIKNMRVEVIRIKHYQ